MQGEMVAVHVRGPIGKNVLQFVGIGNAERQVDVRPPVLNLSRRRTCDCRPTHAAIAGSFFQ